MNAYRPRCPDCGARMRPRDFEDDRPIRCRECDYEFSPRRRESPSSQRGSHLGWLMPTIAVVLGMAGLAVIAVVVLVLTRVGPGPAGVAESSNGGVQDPVGQIKASTVYVRIRTASGDIGSGTGFFAGRPGLIVTNAHVVGIGPQVVIPINSVEVIVNSGEVGERTLSARVFGCDASSDLALLEVDARDLPPTLSFGRSAELVEAQEVMVFGYPFGEKLGKNISVNRTSVSSLRKERGQIAIVQLAGGVNPGNSGGPVADANGKVIGVTVAKLKMADTIAFAIPAETTEAFVRDQIQAGGRKDYGRLPGAPIVSAPVRPQPSPSQPPVRLQPTPNPNPPPVRPQPSPSQPPLGPQPVVLPQRPAAPSIRLVNGDRLNLYIDAVISTDSTALIAYPGCKLMRINLPNAKQSKTYFLSKDPYRMVLDAKRGVLYAVCVEPTPGMARTFPSERRGLYGKGDLCVFDVSAVLKGDLPDGTQLTPTRTVPLGGTVSTLLMSPDGAWVYYLDLDNDRIGRFDTATGMVRIIDNLDSKTEAMCLTPDGTTLYAASHDGKFNHYNHGPFRGTVQKIDTAKFKVEKSVKVNAHPQDVRATNDHLVFLSAGSGQHVGCTLVDMKTGEQKNRWCVSPGSDMLCLSPDQKFLFVSHGWHGTAHIHAVEVPKTLTERASDVQVYPPSNFAARREMRISPDGRYLMCDAGQIIHIER